jgi:hypothetical protein
MKIKPGRLLSHLLQGIIDYGTSAIVGYRSKSSHHLPIEVRTIAQHPPPLINRAGKSEAGLLPALPAIALFK